ncbi:MAG: hypothetical protein KGI60_02950 [Patescibacteria group bacterium]|nr:hypothetical protein [Patescibacteria group bacterium]
MKQEKDFERQAATILKYLRSDMRYDLEKIPRPFFIELTGSPSAGKTTVITELDKFFRRQGFRVWRPQEGAEVIRHIPRTTPDYNTRTGLYALSILLDESYRHGYDIIIFDRAVFDAYGWMMYWEGKGLLTPEQRMIFQQFFLSDFWVHKIDMAYFMISSPEVAMQRELKIALSSKLGETTNPATVKTLVDRYMAAYTQLSPRFPQLRLMDTTHLGEQEMVAQVATEILDAMESKALQNSR